MERGADGARSPALLGGCKCRRRLPSRGRARSLDRDGLGEVAGLVDVAASPDGDVIREQLQRDDRKNRRQQIARRREFDHVVRNNRRDRVAFSQH